MRNINKFAFLLFIIFFLPLINSASWITNTSKCNSYRYYTDTLFGGINFYASNGLVYRGVPPHCAYEAGHNFCDAFEISNVGDIDTRGYGATWANGMTLPLPCPSSVCTYLVEVTGEYGPSLFNTSMTFHLYSGCEIPSLITFNSSILSDRYKIGINVSNPDNAWAWNCTLTLFGDGSQTYTAQINTNQTLDILFTSYPKSYTLANLVCYYTNPVGSSINFYARTILVDTSISYGIHNVFYTPSRLHPYQTLDTIKFEVLSEFDGTHYPSAIHAELTSPTNISALNCSGAVNITRDFANANQYYFSPMVICNNPASIQFTISAEDQGSSEALGSYTFNATWENGSMVIDNVNLIKRITTGNLELWATVSNDYTKSPIPLASNLTCNYTIASYDTGVSYSGALEEDITYIHLPNAYFTITQTDMKNQTVIAPTGYNLSNKFQVFIDCSANNYANASTRVNRWVGNRRLKTFKCLEYEYSIFPRLGIAYFSNAYDTNSLYVQCTIIPDLDLTNANDIEQGVITRLYSDFIGGRNDVVLATNINPNGNNNCQDAVSGETTSSDNPYTHTITFKTSLHERDQNCFNFIALQEGKVSLDLAGFEMFSTGSNNLITNATITQTTSSITFDLAYLPKASVTNTTLAFVVNKTDKRNIIEINDNLVCITSITDPSSTVNSVDQVYYDADDPTHSCSASTVSRKSGGNFSDTYASYLKVNSTSCPFFVISNLTGHLVCKSTVYQMGYPTTEQVSNSFLFITPTKAIQPEQNPLRLFELISRASDMLLNPLLAFLIADPLKFLLVVFIILLGIVFFIAFSRFSEALRNMFKGEE